MQRKKVLCFLSSFFISTFFLLLLPASVNAEWTKFSENPVLVPGKTGAWDSQGVFAPTVLFDGIDYKMWYDGRNGSHQQIGHAISNDGITWSKHPGNPVLSPGTLDEWDEIDITEPVVLFDHDENIYKMWYTSIRPSQGTGKERFQIRYAFSNDCINWIKHPNPILHGNSNTWESEGVSQPYVKKEGGVYKMWYSARDSYGKWRIGHANSSDGINWTKYVNNPILYPTEPWESSTVGKSSVLDEESTYRIWYHAGPVVPHNIAYATSTDGIHWTKPAGENPVLERGPQPFDSTYIAAPFVIKREGVYQMWYSGYNGSQWQIGYASTGEIATPTPTPTLTPTPTPTPTPTSSLKSPIVFLPGFGASWNFKKIFLGEEVPQSEWRMTPFVKHYNNLIATLDAADYTKDEDLFVFNYDWTKPVNQIADNLKNYIDEVVDPPKNESSGKEVKLIGHSLGGLVSRAYVQNNPGNHQVNQLITLGSPHKGVVQFYRAWEGACLHDLLGQPSRLVAELLLALRGREYKNKVEAIRNLVPSIKDLLFIDDYLKEHPSGTIIAESSLSQQNLWLKNLGVTDELTNLLDAVAGKVADTYRWFKVVNPSKIDAKLNRWEDGKPVGEEFEIGDQTILADSAGPDETNVTEVVLNHGDLVRTQKGIETVLALLGMNDASAVINDYPPDSPFLVFVLASPGNLRVTNPLGEKAGFDISPSTIPHALFLVEEKMVVIPEAIDGEYKVEVVGDDENGSYRVIAGQLTDEEDIWTEYQGDISPSETDTYTVEIDSSLKTTPSHLVYLINQKLLDLFTKVNESSLSHRQKRRVKMRIIRILARVKPTKILLKFKRKKVAGRLVKKALSNSLNLADYLEKNGAVSLLDPTREIVDLLDQLHQLLSS